MRNAHARLMGAFFAGPAETNTPDQSLISPASRLDLLDRFDASSHAFAAARGYDPDFSDARTALAAENWTPVPDIPLDRVQAVLDTGAQIAGEADTPQARSLARPKPVDTAPRYELKVKLRPWAVNLIERVRRR